MNQRPHLHILLCCLTITPLIVEDINGQHLPQSPFFLVPLQKCFSNSAEWSFCGNPSKESSESEVCPTPIPPEVIVGRALHFAQQEDSNVCQKAIIWIIVGAVGKEKRVKSSSCQSPGTKSHPWKIHCTLPPAEATSSMG